MFTLKRAPLPPVPYKPKYPFCQEAEVFIQQLYNENKTLLVGCDESGVSDDSIRHLLSDLFGAYMDDDVCPAEGEKVSLAPLYGDKFYVTYELVGRQTNTLYDVNDPYVEIVRRYNPDAYYES